MPITLGSNIATLRAQRTLAQGSSALGTAFERLSSGQRINKASDDAAGLSIASTLRSNSRVFNQAIRNLNDGISAASVAEGALGALRTISERQLELAEQAANGTYSLTQRKALNTEANKLVDEFNRIVGSASFNGINVLDPAAGDITIQAGFGTSGMLTLDLTGGLSRLIGDGTFASALSYVVGRLPVKPIAGDFNGDGYDDLLVSNYSDSSIGVLIANSDGSFKAMSTFVVGEPFGSSIGDINGDGILDVAVTNYLNGITILIGNGNGTFSFATTLAFGSSPVPSVVFSDINNDGNLDLIAAHGGTGVTRAFLGNGDGSFSFGATIAGTGSFPTGVAVGDFNNDGKIDLAISDTGFDRLMIAIGNGDGSFGAAISALNLDSGMPYGVQVADLNNDGFDDLVYAESTPGNLVAVYGNGNGTFRAGVTLTLGVGFYGVSVGDLNGDGYLDLVTTDYSGSAHSLSVFLSNGDGTFRGTATTPEWGNSSYSNAIGDFNGDGVPDLVASDAGNDTVGVFLGHAVASSTIAHLDLLSQDSARAALDTVRETLGRIQSQTATIGATLSRFQTAISHIQTMSENSLAAAGRITDADIAAESAELVRRSILQQSAASVLAQASQQPQLALKLLQG